MLNRSARAILSFLNDLLSDLTKAFIALAIAPLIVANLGTNVFGAWKLIGRTTDFLTLGNFKPLPFLQLSLAKEISNEDFTYKQQQVGCAIAILLLTLPILLISSSLLFYFRDIFIPVSKDISNQVDSTLLVMILYVIISPFYYLPSHIVKGLNMHYLRFGLSSITAVITAILQYAVVSQGYSLPWFAAVAYFPLLTAGIVNCLILAKHVPAIIELVWPSVVAIRIFFKKNIWMLAVDALRSAFSMAELILIGIYFGATATAIYTLTKTLVTFLLMLVNSLFSSAVPGIGDLIGRNAQKTLQQLHSEQINVAIFLCFVIGMIVMFFNAPFVRLWIDAKHFGGEILSRWFIIACIIEVLVKIEANYLDAFLKLKRQAFCLGLTVIVYLTTIVSFEPILSWHIVPIAQTISQVLLIILYWTRFKDCLPNKLSSLVRMVLRPLSIALLLAYSVSWIKLPEIKNWIELCTQAFGIATIAAIVGWFLILKKSDRKMLTARLLKVIGK